MRLLVILSLIMLFGCISFNRGNQTNNTTIVPPVQNNSTSNFTNNTNITPPAPKEFVRYNASSFSFEYPANMDIQTSTGENGIFTGTHEVLTGQTGEVMAVTYVNTLSTFGKNKDDLYKKDPSGTASEFLLEDNQSDPVSILSSGYDFGNVTTFGIVRDASASGMQFKIKFGNDSIYSGYAIDIYVPERSTLVRFRTFALDPDKAAAIKDNFLLSFRVE